MARTKDILRHIPLHREKAKNYLIIDFAQGQVLGLPEARTNAQGPLWQTPPNKLAPRYHPRHNNTKSSQRVTSAV